MDVRERDRKFVARAPPTVGMQVAPSDGTFIYDHHGKKYIDVIMGWWVGNLGWGNEGILAEVRNFDGPAYVHLDQVCRPWSELAEMLADITPKGLTNCCRATGGSEAVEIALQVAMAATGRAGSPPLRTPTTPTRSVRGASASRTGRSTPASWRTAIRSSCRWTVGRRRRLRGSLPKGLASLRLERSQGRAEAAGAAVPSHVPRISK